MKKIISMCIASLLMFTLIISPIYENNSVARAETLEDFDCELLSDGTIEVGHYEGTNAFVTVPSTISGYKVSQIGNYFLSGNSDVKNVEIEEGIEKIGYHAFAYMDSLEKIKLPNSLRFVGTEILCECPRLTSIEIPSGINEMSDGMLSDCENLTSATIKCNVTGSYMFSDGG